MRRAPEAWTPLVDGESAERVLAAVEDIARDLSGPRQAAPGPGLSGGQAGLALFFSYCERSLGLAGAGELAESHLERAIAELAEQPKPNASLYHGFAGVAWVAEHLVLRENSAEDEDLNEEIDEALLSLLRRSSWRGEAELLGGLAGWSVYALERLPRPSAVAMLPLLLGRLAEQADAVRESDQGMAHGAAGVIAVLARMLREGAAGPEAGALLTALVDGILARRPPSGEHGEGDLAWCAAVAGLSVALLAAGRACGREDWERTALRLAAVAAARYPDAEDIVEGFDPALCHGTAGLSHLFHRLHRATGDPVFFAAAGRWLERTLARRRPGEGIGGYLSRRRLADGRPGWIADPGFLGGAAGIGLALLASATPVEPAWDRLLLLS
jgi:hypothetical protein